MSSQSDDRSPNAPSHATVKRLYATIVTVTAMTFVAAAIGFVGFLSQLRGAETRPVRQADGIVVLTGAASRIPDAIELLAADRGKRLLITGVHRDTIEWPNFHLGRTVRFAAGQLLPRCATTHVQ